MQMEPVIRVLSDDLKLFFFVVGDQILEGTILEDFELDDTPSSEWILQ